jgi:hypothetical protein
VVFVIVAVAVVSVVVIALIFVGDAVGKTSKMPDQIVVDVHEAINFCAEALPSEVTAVMTFDDLRRLLRLHLEWIQAYHWSPEGSDEGPILFEEFDALDYVMERTAAIRLDVPREHVAQVIDVHSSYLQVMGAIHLEDPVKVEADLAELPLSPEIVELGGDGTPELEG